MPQTLQKSPVQDAAKGLKGVEKKLFLDAVQQFFADPAAVSLHNAALVREYIEAKMRAGILKKLLDAEVEDDGFLAMATPRIVALIRQSDATAKLLVKLGDRLEAAQR